MIFPLIFKSLYDCSRGATENIQNMASNVLDLYKELDGEMYHSLVKQYTGVRK